VLLQASVDALGVLRGAIWDAQAREHAGVTHVAGHVIHLVGVLLQGPNLCVRFMKSVFVCM